MNSHPNGWEDGVLVQPLVPVFPPKMCEAEGCTEMFAPTWHSQRRCENCRRLHMPYKGEAPELPF